MHKVFHVSPDNIVAVEKAAVQNQCGTLIDGEVLES